MNTFRDIGFTLRRIPLLIRVANMEVGLRYRRLFLGQFWFVSTFVTRITIFTLVFSNVFSQKPENFLPFFAAGFINWHFLVGGLNRATTGLIRSENFIVQFGFPPIFYVFRELIIGFRELALYAPLIVIIFLVSDHSLTLQDVYTYFLMLPLVTIELVSVMTCISLLTPYFRDLQQFISSITLMAFMVTPIFWLPKSVEEDSLILLLNPFWHLVAILRDPLLGTSVNQTNLFAVLIMIAITLPITILLYEKLGRQVVLRLN